MRPWTVLQAAFPLSLLLAASIPASAANRLVPSNYRLNPQGPGPGSGLTRFYGEYGESFLYPDQLIARAYRDGQTEVVYLGDDSERRPSPEDLREASALRNGFPAGVHMSIRVIPKDSSTAGRSLEFMMKNDLKDLKIGGVFPSTRSLSESWPPDSMLLRTGPPANMVRCYSQTRAHWLIWTAQDPDIGGRRREFELVRRSLSEFLDEKSREDGPREALPKAMIRILPAEGYDEFKDFEGQTGLAFKFPARWILESRVREGVEKAWLHQEFGGGAPSRGDADYGYLHIEPSDYRIPANFSRWGLVEVDAIPKKDGKQVRSLDLYLHERTQELTQEGVVFSTDAAVFGAEAYDWPAGTFSLQIERPYRLWEFYTQNDKAIIHFTAGAAPRGAPREVTAIRDSIQDSVSRYTPRLEDPEQKASEEEPPRRFPRDPMIPICALVAGFLAMKSGSPKIRRVAFTAMAVLAASCVGEFIACRIPDRIFLSAAIQHALAFAAFGAALGSDRRKRVSAAIVGGAVGALQGLLFGWAPRAWESLHAGYGPGYGLLVDIGFSYSDRLPYLLPELNIWTQALVASLAVHWALRKEPGYPALVSFSLTSAPMLLWPLPSAFFGAFGLFFYSCRSTPSQECLIATVCAIGAVFGATALENRMWWSSSRKIGRAPL